MLSLGDVEFCEMDGETIMIGPRQNLRDCNIAEYEALLTGLKLAKAIGAEVLNMKSDSQLVVHQFVEIYEAKEPTLRKYFAEVKEWAKKFHKVQIEQVPREANKATAYLVRMASGDPTEELFLLAPVIELKKPSYEDAD